MTNSARLPTCDTWESLPDFILGGKRWADVESDDDESTESDMTSAGAARSVQDLETSSSAGVGGASTCEPDEFVCDHATSDGSSEELVSHAGAGDGLSLNGQQTLMLRNLPSRCFEPRLAAELERVGFGGLFDYVYVPPDTRGRNNRGMAFINFTSSAVAGNFHGSYHGCYLGSLCGEDPLVVTPAEVQGLDANLSQRARMSGRKKPWVKRSDSHGDSFPAGKSGSASVGRFDLQVDQSVEMARFALENTCAQRMVAHEVQRQWAQFAQSSPAASWPSSSLRQSACAGCQQLMRPGHRFCPFCGVQL